MSDENKNATEAAPALKEGADCISWHYDKNGKVNLKARNCATGEYLSWLPICGATFVDEDNKPLDKLPITFNSESGLLQIPCWPETDAFTDEVSDANEPLCRTEIVRGDDGKLYGPAPHRTKLFQVPRSGTKTFRADAGQLSPGGELYVDGGWLVIDEEIGVIKKENPSPCRPFCFFADLRGRLGYQHLTTDTPQVNNPSPTAILTALVDVRVNGGAWQSFDGFSAGVSTGEEQGSSEIENVMPYLCVGPGEPIVVDVRLKVDANQSQQDTGYFAEVFYARPSISIFGTTDQ